MSGHEVEVPDLHDARRRFIDLLHAEPVGGAAPTNRDAVLREAFGLTGNGAAPRQRTTIGNLREALPDAEAR